MSNLHAAGLPPNHLMHDQYTGRNRKASLDSRQRTNCSICRLGIFFGQPTVWTRGQYLGFSHAWCADELCSVCGQWVEGLLRSGSEQCDVCAFVLEQEVRALVLERFGDPKEAAKELYGPTERTRR